MTGTIDADQHRRYADVLAAEAERAAANLDRRMPDLAAVGRTLARCMAIAQAAKEAGALSADQWRELEELERHAGAAVNAFGNRLLRLRALPEAARDEEAFGDLAGIGRTLALCMSDAEVITEADNRLSDQRVLQDLWHEAGRAMNHLQGQLRRLGIGRQARNGDGR